MKHEPRAAEHPIEELKPLHEQPADLKGSQRLPGPATLAPRDSEELYRKIFDHSNDAIFIIDPARDEILDVNPRACGMLGYSRQELLSVPVSAIHPREMPELRAFARSVSGHGQGWTNELTCSTRGGQVLPAKISASAIDIAGKSYIIALVRDITERRRAEETLRGAGGAGGTKPSGPRNPRFPGPGAYGSHLAA